MVKHLALENPVQRRLRRDYRIVVVLTMFMDELQQIYGRITFIGSTAAIWARTVT